MTEKIIELDAIAVMESAIGYGYRCTQKGDDQGLTAASAWVTALTAFLTSGLVSPQ